MADVLLEVRDAVGWVTLNRPERLNAIGRGTIDALQSLLDEVDHRQDVRCLVFTGSGRAFSAGADVKEWYEGTQAQGLGWVPRMHALILRLRRFRLPLVAAVNGVAVGAGCDLALACDIRIGSTGARFGEVYVNVGTVPDAGGTYLLPRIVGHARAAEMILTGRIIDAEEAYRYGLLNRLVQPEALMDECHTFARGLAEGPTVAMGLARRNLDRTWHLDLEAELAEERAAGERCSATADHAEGLKAAYERRKPNFAGR
jgi:enoyl-CoA hydratase/carnithine racemase